MQLSQRVRARDVEDFFSSVGKVRDVKLIVCNKTRRFKGISYVEFKDLESVPLALGLSGKITSSFKMINILCDSFYFDLKTFLEKGTSIFES